MVYATVSPNGEQLAAVRLVEGEPVVTLIDTETLIESTIFSAAEYVENDASVSELVWLDDKHLALQFSEIHKGIEDLLDTKLSRRLLILRLAMNRSEIEILSVRTKGWLAHALPHSANTLLYAKSGIASKVYSLDIQKLAADKARLGKLDRIDGGQFKKVNELQSINGYAIRWYFNNEGIPQSVLAFAKGKLTLFSFTANIEEPKILKVWGDDDKANAAKNDVPHLIPTVLAKSGSSFYSLDINEETEKSVYRIDFETGLHEKIYETASYKILNILIDEERNFIGVKVLKNGTTVHEYIADSEPNIKANSDNINTLYNYSLDGSVTLSYVEAHNYPGRFILNTPKTNSGITLGQLNTTITAALPSRQFRDTLLINDLEIPYILTLPPNKEAPYPLIVLPHGGPIGVHDSPYFDEVTQFIAAQGYAVLRVNYRGSSGHSTALYDGGKKEWGNLILDDIHKTALNIRGRDDIAAEKTCLMGMSYGGYATAALLTQYPDIYKCGVAISGVYDLNLYVSGKKRSIDQQQWINDFIGDASTEYDRLKSISPLYNAGKLTRPLLIAHGEDDTVVNVEHAYRYHLMLKKYDAEVELYIDKELGHSFEDSERTIKLMTAAQEFLSKHLP
jgi:Dipeptidyl aminopeptidases/acylaminoacyl-peptidases